MAWRVVGVVGASDEGRPGWQRRGEQAWPVGYRPPVRLPHARTGRCGRCGVCVGKARFELAVKYIQQIYSLSP